VIRVAALAALVLAAPAAAAPPDVIRSGGPSRPGQAKVAVVATAHNLVGKRFRVLDESGQAVLTGRLTRAAGAASPWKRAAVADLTPVKAPGAYRVVVGRLRSRAWIVADYAGGDTIAIMLQFFAANADGNESSPVHGPSHLNDADVASGPYAGQHFDLTGGWMDAGDQVKFTQTTGFAAMALQAAARFDPAQADALNAAADVGIRWLVKAHPRPDLFIAQVGDQRDHDLGFRDPAKDDAMADEGIGKRVAYPDASADLTGKAAAALAMAAQRASGPVRDQLVQQAREWYAAGVASAKPAALAGDFYTSSSYVDDLAVGATELYRATGEQHFLDEARGYLQQASLDAGFTWDEIAAFAVADLCGVLGAPPLDEQLCARLADAGSGPIARSRRDAFGIPADFGWGVTASSAAGALSALLGERAGVLAGGARVAAGARDYLLGRNPWGASFVVGYGPRSPRHPHHWASVFGPAKPVGAVVGGPAPPRAVKEQKLELRRNVFDSTRAVYTDDVDNYVTSEPAIDYTAGSVLLLAALGQ
jgi:hypothetical protein